jgi:hypothetical protein
LAQTEVGVSQNYHGIKNYVRSFVFDIWKKSNLIEIRIERNKPNQITTVSYSVDSFGLQSLYDCLWYFEATYKA